MSEHNRAHSDRIPLHDLLALDFERPEKGSRHAEVRMPVRPEAFGFTANLHGGAIATMVDLACALAAARSSDFDVETQSMVTSDMHIRYLGRPRTDTVVAKAEVVRVGSPLIVVECRVVDDEEHLVAVADFSMMIVTLVLTLIIPLQYAVLVGVGISMILYIARQSNQLSAKRLVRDDGRFRTTDPPDVVPAHDVIIIQPFGSLFFASAPMFEEQLPTVEPTSTGSVVILRLRGKDDLGSTVIEVLKSYATSLLDVGSKLVIITDSDTVVGQLASTGATDLIGEENIVRGTQWLTEALQDTAEDADAWVDDHRSPGSPDTSE